MAGLSDFPVDISKNGFGLEKQKYINHQMHGDVSASISASSSGIGYTSRIDTRSVLNKESATSSKERTGLPIYQDPEAVADEIFIDTSRQPERYSNQENLSVKFQNNQPSAICLWGDNKNTEALVYYPKTGEIEFDGSKLVAQQIATTVANNPKFLEDVKIGLMVRNRCIEGLEQETANDPKLKRMLDLNKEHDVRSLELEPEATAKEIVGKLKEFGTPYTQMSNTHAQEVSPPQKTAAPGV